MLAVVTMKLTLWRKNSVCKAKFGLNYNVVASWFLFLELLLKVNFAKAVKPAFENLLCICKVNSIWKALFYLIEKLNLVWPKTDRSGLPYCQQVAGDSEVSKAEPVAGGELGWWERGGNEEELWTSLRIQSKRKKPWRVMKVNLPHNDEMGADGQMQSARKAAQATSKRANPTKGRWTSLEWVGNTVFKRDLQAAKCKLMLTMNGNWKISPHCGSGHFSWLYCYAA